MAQTHITKTIADIKAKLDAILTECLDIDSQITAGLRNDWEFLGSLRYYEMQAKKIELGSIHRKLTDALVAIEQYLK